MSGWSYDLTEEDEAIIAQRAQEELDRLAEIERQERIEYEIASRVRDEQRK